MSASSHQGTSLGSALSRTWQRLPVVIRAILAGSFVFEIGVAAWVWVIAPLVPAPWSVLVMGAVLWGYWQYFSGSGPPRTTSMARRNFFRAIKLPVRVWQWSLLAALAFVVIVQSAFVVTFRLIAFPAVAFTAEYGFDAMPAWTAWLLICMSSLVAGVCEETGLRGYMQVSLEERYGPVTAIAIVSAVFLVIHLHQAWAPPILVHIVVMSALLGVLAYASGSLLPAMLGHIIMDVLNFSYWWSDVAGAFERRPIAETGVDPHFLLWALLLVTSLALYAWSVHKTLGARKNAVVC